MAVFQVLRRGECTTIPTLSPILDSFGHSINSSLDEWLKLTVIRCFKSECFPSTSTDGDTDTESYWNFQSNKLTTVHTTTHQRSRMCTQMSKQIPIPISNWNCICSSLLFCLSIHLQRAISFVWCYTCRRIRVLRSTRRLIAKQMKHTKIFES